MDEYWTNKQKENIVWFNENVETLAADPLYRLKFAIILESKVKGIFDTFDTALNEAATKFPNGEYIIQQIVSQKETINFLYPALALG
ncbi:hypothetical protein AGMMS49928_28300 [Spirochaetia bacterium]|nr:hypothetical protein AGMMS49928_28300 [Spirochaetia bacterium]